MVEPTAKSSPENTITVGMLAQRLDGMDKAIELLQELADKQPTPGHVQLSVDALKELTQAKLDAMQALADAKFEGNKTALEAALKAQKEDASKIEGNFTKQMDNVADNIRTLTKSMDDKLTDLKDRYNTREGVSSGSGAANASSRALLFSVVSVVIGLSGLGFGLMAVFRG